LALALGALGASGAHAQPTDTVARRLVAAIEHRASASSFAALNAFGDAASRQSGPEALRRLHHVAQVMLNQSEFDRFEHWNGVLAAKAAQEGNRRYAEIAELDELKGRYDRGDTSYEAAIARIGDTEPDWYARSHALATEGLILNTKRESGAALKLMFQAEKLIPRGDPDTDMAESDVWGTIGVALIQLNDLEGAADAFWKADFVWADKAYPRPDFDDVYNMAVLATQLGRADFAQSAAAAHHRLAARSDLAHLDVWDKYLCATVAERFEAPKDVTGCLSGIDAKLTGAEFLAPRLLSMRGVAEARLGQIDAAKADLAQMQTLKGSTKFAGPAFSRLPELQAELMSAERQDRAAFAMLRDYSQARAQDAAARSSAGVSEVTAELERQLDSRSLMNRVFEGYARRIDTPWKM